jgi:Ca2+-binding RTX toxin-like protein
MTPRRARFGVAGLVLLVLVAGGAFTASSSVPSTHASKRISAIGANDLKPSACSGITVTNKIVAAGDADGSSGNDLLIGRTAGQRLRGRDGNDCIVGGAGDDELIGEAGTDVCIGGPGNDTLDGTCETRIQ